MTSELKAELCLRVARRAVKRDGQVLEDTALMLMNLSTPQLLGRLASKPVPVTPTWTVYHEVGHAVIATIKGFKVEYMAVTPRQVRKAHQLYCPHVPNDPDNLGEVSYVLKGHERPKDICLVKYAGHCATVAMGCIIQNPQDTPDWISAYNRCRSQPVRRWVQESLQLCRQHLDTIRAIAYFAAQAMQASTPMSGDLLRELVDRYRDCA